MKTQEKISEILREARWSQEELARRLNVSFKTLNGWATGKAEPRVENAQAIEQIYLDIVGRTEVSPALLRTAEEKALATHIELDELLVNPELLRTATLYLTYHTNSIEGSTMTMDDVATVLDDEDAVIPDKSVREQLEARNHRAALNYLLTELKRQGREFRWTSDLIRNTHLRLMNGLIESAGNYRSYGVRVMGSKTPRTNFMSVSMEIDRLVDLMNTPYDNLIERIATTHAIFERIHPFGDGNGRTGRLMMFAQALRDGMVPPLVIRERKRAYYRYLELAHLREDYDPLRLFVAESVLFTDDLLEG